MKMHCVLHCLHRCLLSRSCFHLFMHASLFAKLLMLCAAVDGELSHEDLPSR